MIRQFLFWLRTGKCLVVPTHRLALAAGIAPVPRVSDDGDWRRVMMVSWEPSIPEEDAA